MSRVGRGGRRGPRKSLRIDATVGRLTLHAHVLWSASVVCHIAGTAFHSRRVVVVVVVLVSRCSVSKLNHSAKSLVRKWWWRRRGGLIHVCIMLVLPIVRRRDARRDASAPLTVTTTLFAKDDKRGMGGEGLRWLS